MNAAGFERSRWMGLADIRGSLVEARRRLLAAFGELEDLTPDADEWFDETGPTHYRKHAGDLEAWVRRLHELRAGMPSPPAPAP